MERALKVLDLIKYHADIFISANCLCSLFISLVRYLLKYNVVIWHP